MGEIDEIDDLAGWLSLPENKTPHQMG